MRGVKNAAHNVTAPLSWCTETTKPPWHFVRKVFGAVPLAFGRTQSTIEPCLWFGRTNPPQQLGLLMAKTPTHDRAIDRPSLPNEYVCVCCCLWYGYCFYFRLMWCVCRLSIYLCSVSDEFRRLALACAVFSLVPSWPPATPTCRYGSKRTRAQQPGRKSIAIEPKKKQKTRDHH